MPRWSVKISVDERGHRDAAIRADGRRAILTWLAVAIVSGTFAWWCFDGYRDGRNRLAEAGAAGISIDYSVIRSNRNALVLGLLSGGMCGVSLLSGGVSLLASRLGRRPGSGD